MQHSELTPLYHEVLDSHGFHAGTRIWNADSGYTAVEQLRVGDEVFGITFRLETEYLPLHDRSENPAGNLIQVWRPTLTVRKVLAIQVVEARAWQLTFGDAERMFESRRLVAGADTLLRLGPLAHDVDSRRRLVDCYTATANPRRGSLIREAYDVEVEDSGHVVRRPSPYTGMPRGDYAVIIPSEAAAGQLGLIDRTGRPYHRYLFTQIREVIPLIGKTTLYQLTLQPDTLPEFAASPDQPRVNVIAQTPFAPEKKTRRYVPDALADEVQLLVRDPNELTRKWDEWVQQRGVSERPSARAVEMTTTMQETFYNTLSGPAAKALEDQYGIRGGWLDGGILIDLPA